jgi:uncharacterized protein (TIGR02268 family)
MLIALALLVARPALAATAPPDCTREVLAVELAENAVGPAPEVCITPGRATAWVFDASLLPDSLALEGRERFLLVEPGRRGILLVPSGALRAGERLKLTARFADDVVPVSAQFVLVVHPTRGARQVDVFRRPRSANLLHAELLRKEAELRRVQEENTRLHAALSRAEGFVGLHASGLMDARGISARDLSREATLPSDSVLKLRRLFSQRSVRRVAVVLDLENPDATRPWVTQRAKLTRSQGAREDLEVLGHWQPEPIPPGGIRRIVIEAKADPTSALGVYTLTLSEAAGVRSVTLGGVTFPDLVPAP